MGLPVVTVAAGGLPVVEATAGTPVTEAANGRGIAITKVIGKPGLPVVFETIGVAPGVTYATWNASDKSANITLSNGNLTATASSATGSAVRTTISQSTGKYYFEIAGTGTPANSFAGLTTGTKSLDTIQASASSCILARFSDGLILNELNFVGNMAGGAAGVNGDVTCLAVDMTNKRIWFRRNSTNWNDNASFNPATNVGGYDISPTFASTAAFPFVSFNGTGFNYIANFGASTFVGAVPAGFTSGWPT
jgi:hypothetical protein